MGAVSQVHLFLKIETDLFLLYETKLLYSNMHYHIKVIER